MSINFNVFLIRLHSPDIIGLMYQSGVLLMFHFINFRLIGAGKSRRKYYGVFWCEQKQQRMKAETGSKRTHT